MPLRILLMALVVAGLSHRACAGDANQRPASFSADNGVDVAIKGLFQYDSNQFSDDSLPNGTRRFDNAQAWRRKEVNVYAHRKDAFNAVVGYDFQAHAWLDGYVAVETAAGGFRLGQFKTLVSSEYANVSSAATLFLERGLPAQAVYEGRRVGFEWLYGGVPEWQFQAAFFERHDFNHDAAGETFTGRAVYTPILVKAQVLHLGLAASRELRDDRMVRIRARPEVDLNPVRLVDTGILRGVTRIDRWGLDAAWIDTSILLQSEYLALQAVRPGAVAYRSHGYAMSGSWLLTGESRDNQAAAIANPVPHHDWGAVEVALRYASLDLNDGAVMGGREQDWTVGVNWYLGVHFKLQANYIRAFSERGNLPLDPVIYAVRAQLAF